VHNEIFDLFALLDANEAQLDFPTLFASGREGWAVGDLADLEGGRGRDLSPLFELIVSHVRPPAADPNAPFSMLATTLDYDPYLGRVLTGLIHSGSPASTCRSSRWPVAAGHRAGALDQIARLPRPRSEADEEAQAGDIIAVAGLTATTVADTICAPRSPRRCRPTRSIRRPWR